MSYFELSNPIIEPESRKPEQPGFDFDFDIAQAPNVKSAGGEQRECTTCWKWQECELRKANGVTGCGELF
jgi:hypothetical protein